MLELRFVLDPADDPRVIAFLQAHLDDMHRISPPESVHALDAEQLRQADIRFWTAWVGDVLVGSCALKRLDDVHLELKTMRVEADYRGAGVAQQLLDFVLRQAQQSGARRSAWKPVPRTFLRRHAVCMPAMALQLAKPLAAIGLTPTVAS